MFQAFLLKRLMLNGILNFILQGRNISLGSEDSYML